MNVVLSKLLQWLLFSFLAEMVPLGLLRLTYYLADPDVTNDKVFEHSIFIVVGFGIFLSVIGDLFVDDLWIKISPYMQVMSMFLLIVMGSLIGLSVAADVFDKIRTTSTQQGNASQTVARDDSQHAAARGILGSDWLSVQILVTALILLYAASTKTWMLTQRSVVVEATSNAESLA